MSQAKRETFPLFRVVFDQRVDVPPRLVEVEVFETPTMYKTADGLSRSEWRFRRFLRKSECWQAFGRGNGGTPSDGWHRDRESALAAGAVVAAQRVVAARHDLTRAKADRDLVRAMQ